MRRRTAHLAAAALLALHLLLALGASRRIGVTTDEPVGIVGGLGIVTRGEMVLNYEHPPLVKVLAALPLALRGVRLDASDPDYAASRQWAYARRFLFAQPDPDGALLSCRAAVVLLSLLLGAAIYQASLRVHGAAGGLLSLAAYALDPSFLGHAPLVQFDVGLSLFVFLSATLFARALEAASPRAYVLPGLCLGAGLATKFTALFLLPVWAALALHRRARIRGRAAATVAGLLLAMVAAAAALSLGYGMVLVPDFVRGFTWQLEHAGRGHVSYFMGSVRQRGTPLYFPVAFLLKTPLETLALLALLAATALRGGLSAAARTCLVAGLAFFVLLLPSSIDIGHRYMLPVYPFLFVALGSLADPALGFRLAGSWAPSARRIAVVLVLFLAARSVAVFPDYIGFTNALAGKEPERYLADSNLDWGQDLPRLDAWLAERGRPEIALAYTGMDSPEHRGIDFRRGPCQREPGLHAASVNAVVGLLPAYDRDCSSWLAQERPIARIGTSILVYDVPAGGAP